jgi:hypothetical protein
MYAALDREVGLLGNLNLASTVRPEGMQVVKFWPVVVATEL